MQTIHQGTDESEVPNRIFKEFVEDLKSEKVDPTVCERIRKALLEARDCSEKALRDAILKEEQLP